MSDVNMKLLSPLGRLQWQIESTVSTRQEQRPGSNGSERISEGRRVGVLGEGTINAGLGVPSSDLRKAPIRAI